MVESEEQPSEQHRERHELCRVAAARLGDRGDIHRSYSADIIASGQRVRTPFRHSGQSWVCVSIAGSGLTRSGFAELQAYRLTPESLYVGMPTTYRDRTANADAAEAARSDPFGFYHGMSIKHGGEAFVLTGPPVHFVPDASPSRPDGEGAEPIQLTLF
jgi:hypothetical protein